MRADPDRRFLLQMAGQAGSGKSTLAREVGRATGAVVLDRDYIKSPLLEDGLGEEAAAGPSYSVFFALAASLLGQGFSVVLDSAAFFPSIIERGEKLGCAHGVPYHVIECACDDELERARRLAQRQRLASQPAVLQADRFTRPGAAPLSCPHRKVDMARPLSECLGEALAYIGHDPD